MKIKTGFRIIAFMLVFSILSGGLLIYPSGSQVSSQSDVTNEISKENKEMRLWYSEPAPDDDNREWKYTSCRGTGWETLALALGNSYMGAKVFGLTDRERIQISENSLSTAGGTQNSGTTNFTETYIHFDHDLSEVTDYERDIILNDATSHVSYTYGGVSYEREYFTSYPDKVMVIKLTAGGEGNLSFTLEPTIPYFEFEGKTGDVTVSDIESDGDSLVATITLEGNLPGSNISTTEAGYAEGTGTVGYDMDFEAQYRVFVNGGSMTSAYNSEGGSISDVDEYSNGTLTVSGADSAYIIIALGTNYEIDPIVYSESDNSKKLESFAHPHEKVTAMIEEASAKTFEELRERHIADYTELFSRVSLDLGSEVPDVPTDELLELYRNGTYNPYVEELLFAFGRYTLIASSRDGNLPPNLNGIWNRYHNAICMNGYWGNINIQMNYWAAFNTDLAECFESYVDLYNAYIEANTANCIAQLKKQGSITSDDEAPGLLWSIETGMTPFKAAACYGGRDGWGNTPFMAELFWDYYDYTRDESILSEVTLPALMSSAAYLSLVMEYDEETGFYLAPNSGSPEQSTTSPYLSYVENNPGYVPSGTAYDQALTYSNYLHVLDAVKFYGEENLSDTDRYYLEKIKEQVENLDPIIVGLSGQIKEFREEDYYGEIGESEHRHISHLCSMYPAAVIDDSTPAWLDAAEVSLDSRGDSAIWGWSYVHRIAAYARTGNAEAAYNMLNGEIINTVSDNMWTAGGGNFQVDANLGSPAAISEMLLQSHNGYIEPLAAIPDAWSNGSYSGLVARGNFSIGAAWGNGLATVFEIESRSGGEASVFYPGISKCTVVDSAGNNVSFNIDGIDLISFDTEKGETYTVTGFEEQSFPDAPETLGYSSSELGSFSLAVSSVENAVRYNLYVATGSASQYILVDTSAVGLFTYIAKEGEENVRTTFAATAVNAKGRESERTICYYNPKDLSAGINSVTANVLESGDIQVTVNANGNTAKYRLYSASELDGECTLITESAYPIINGGTFDSSLYYYVSVVNFYDSTESEKVYVNKFGSSAAQEYDATNILSGKTFEAGSLATSTHTGVHDGVTVYYDYSKLTDGATHYQYNRFSTLSSDSSQVFDATVDLGCAYILDELLIDDFNSTAATAPYMGAGLEIQTYSLGEWTTVIKCESNDEIVAYRLDSTYLSFDLGGVRAEKIRIYIPGRFDTNTISVNEIKCAGVIDTNEAIYSDNILLGTSFVPTEAAEAVVHIDSSSNNYDYGYSVITDGGFAAAGSRFSTKTASTAQIVDATVDLDGRHILRELRIYDFNGQVDPNKSDPTYLGTQLVIEVYSDGEWSSVLDIAQSDYAAHRVFVSSTAGGAYLSFDLEGVEAEMLRIYIPSNVSGSSISFYEIECSGYAIGDTGAVGDTAEILSGKEFKPGEDAAYCHASTTGYDGDFGYAKLTDGVFNYKNGRMSTKSGTTHCFDATVDLGGAYKLEKIWLYDYNGQTTATWTDPTFAGSDLRIDALVDGVWVTVVDCDQSEYGSHRGGTAVLYKAYLEFDLGGVIASGLRIYQSGGYSSNAISYHEIELFGAEYIYSASLSDRENIFAELTDVVCNGTVSEESSLADIFDEDVNTCVDVSGVDGSYQLTVSFGETKVMKQLHIFEVIGEGNLVDGVLSTASDATTVEIYREGIWLTVYKNISLGTGLYTELDMFGVDAEGIRFTFKNTRLFDGESEYRCAVISEISCTTVGEPVDRSSLLEAYKTLELLDVSSTFGLDAIKSVRLEELKEFLMDTAADQATVDEYVAAVVAAKEIFDAGAPVTDAYGGFTSYNLSLEGDIGFNFYGEFADSVATDFAYAFVYVEYADGVIEKKLLSELDIDSNGRYVVRFNMAAAQMSDTVKMRIVFNGENCGEYIERSVRDYADDILADDSYETAYPGINALMEAMLNYGAYAQIYFGYNTEDLANSGIDAELGNVTDSSEITEEGSASGLTMKSWTISLESEVNAKIYFVLADGYDINSYTVTVKSPDGTVNALDVENMSSRYRIVIENIPSEYLDDEYTLTITNLNDGSSLDVNISATCYVSRVLSASDDTQLVNLVKALRLYSDAANAYYK